MIGVLSGYDHGQLNMKLRKKEYIILDNLHYHHTALQGFYIWILYHQSFFEVCWSIVCNALQVVSKTNFKKLLRKIIWIQKEIELQNIVKEFRRNSVFTQTDGTVDDCHRRTKAPFKNTEVYIIRKNTIISKAFAGEISRCQYLRKLFPKIGLITKSTFTWNTFYNPAHNIFLKFTVFLWKFDSPQEKWDFISSIINFVYRLPHELPKDLRLKEVRKLDNYSKILESGGVTGYCAVSQKKISKFSGLGQIYLISWHNILEIYCVLAESWFEASNKGLHLYLV